MLIKINKNLIRMDCFFLIFAFLPTVIWADSEKKPSSTPVLLECEANISTAIRLNSPATLINPESLHFFRGNKVFGFNPYGHLDHACKDAEDICKKENCRILSCKEVEGDISDRLAVRCNFGYIFNVHVFFDRQYELKFTSYPDISSVIENTRKTVQIDFGNLAYPLFVSDCALGLEDSDSSWRWLNE